jgi:hypothetical protein
MLPLEIIAVLGVFFVLLVNAMVKTRLAKKLLIDTEQKAEKGVSSAERKAR